MAGLKNRKGMGCFVKSFLAVLIAAAIYMGCYVLFSPVWLEWNNYNTVHGFYKEPENTIETLFLGSSHVVNGITPTELYRDYGLCAYNLGTEQQGVNVSYYWLREAYRLHAESLTTVVFDVSMLRRTASETFVQKGIAGMQLFPGRVQAMYDYYLGPYGTGDLQDVLEQLNPVTAYHTRWNQLTRQDFEKFHLQPALYSRGYHFVSYSLLDEWNAEEDYEEENAPYLESVLDESVPGEELQDSELYYFDKIVAFCKENDLDLVLVKIPARGWGSNRHNAVQALAEKNDLPFLDYNFPVSGQNLVGETYLVDSPDGNHLNYFGATKVTHAIGDYLVKNCRVTDVRGQQNYAFMEQELADYNKNVVVCSELYLATELEQYLTLAAQNENHVIFLSGKDETSGALHEPLRAALADLEFTKLAQIGWRDSYVGVLDRDGVQEVLEKADTQKEAILEGAMQNGVRYSVVGAGWSSEDFSSCSIDETEYSPNLRGLNIVVYDQSTDTVVDVTNFDTLNTTERMSGYPLQEIETMEAEGKTYQDLTENAQKLYRYMHHVENQEIAGALQGHGGRQELVTWLDAYRQKDRVILLAAQGDAADRLSEPVREALAQRGLTQLAELQPGETYFAVIEKDQEPYEQMEGDGTPLPLEGAIFRMIHAEPGAGDAADAQRAGAAPAAEPAGLQLIVYDRIEEEIVAQTSFETFEDPLAVAEREMHNEFQTIFLTPKGQML